MLKAFECFRLWWDLMLILFFFVFKFIIKITESCQGRKINEIKFFIFLITYLGRWDVENSVKSIMVVTRFNRKSENLICVWCFLEASTQELRSIFVCFVHLCSWWNFLKLTFNMRKCVWGEIMNFFVCLFMIPCSEIAHENSLGCFFILWSFKMSRVENFNLLQLFIPCSENDNSQFLITFFSALFELIHWS